MFLFLEVKRNTTDKATGVRIRIGIVAGLIVLLVVNLIQKIRGKSTTA